MHHNMKMPDKMKMLNNTAITSNTQKAALRIAGMHCSSCAQNIEKKLKKQEGITNAKVSYATGSASVEYKPKEVTEQKISEIINEMGYKAFFNAPESGGFATDPVCGMRV